MCGATDILDETSEDKHRPGESRKHGPQHADEDDDAGEDSRHGRHDWSDQRVVGTTACLKPPKPA